MIAGQHRFFPALRSHCGPAMQQKVAKHNVAVFTSDTDHTTIDFVGGMFGSVRYQRGFTEMMWPILRQLRFKTIQYREYRSQGTFASWNILSPEDEVLVIWERDTTGYRTVELGIEQWNEKSGSSPWMASRNLNGTDPLGR